MRGEDANLFLVRSMPSAIVSFLLLPQLMQPSLF
jgi:hypothetical protein